MVLSQHHPFSVLKRVVINCFDCLITDSALNSTALYVDSFERTGRSVPVAFERRGQERTWLPPREESSNPLRYIQRRHSAQHGLYYGREWRPGTTTTTSFFLIIIIIIILIFIGWVLFVCLTNWSRRLFQWITRRLDKRIQFR